jgi:hypothetical protein
MMRASSMAGHAGGWAMAGATQDGGSIPPWRTYSQRKEDAE